MSLIGNRLKRVLEDRGISMRRAATEIGMTGSGLSQAIENDSIKARDIQKIAEFLRVPVETLFSEQSSPVKKRKYIEQRIEDLEKKMIDIEKKIIK